MWTLSEIRAIGDDTYALLFLTAEAVEQAVRCRYVVHNDIEAVRPDPDVFMAGQVPSRQVSAAVIAFHHARLAATSRADSD